MVKSKKKFIDKKKAVTFHLVHRSQHDPLVTDATAPQHVLVEATKPAEKKNQKDEQKKFGIFFDDDYNYLQHLKEPSKEIVWEYVETPNRKKGEAGAKDVPSIQLPSSVFATTYEEEEGMLNKAAPNPGPKPHWDPDIVAALDDDFDFDNAENELEDDFVAKAMDVGGEEGEVEFDENDEDEYIDSDGPLTDDDYSDDDENSDRLGSLSREFNFGREETKSQFTDYTVSCKDTVRNEQLKLLDDRFEKYFSQFNDSKIGALDMEEIEGHMEATNPMLLKYWKEFRKNDKFEKYNKNWDAERIKKYRELHSSEDEELVELEVDDGKKKWDCESILSTYSSRANQPKLIEIPSRRKSKIQIDPKTGIPKDVLRGGDKLTEKKLAMHDNEQSGSKLAGGPKSMCDKSVLSQLSVLSIRPKDETHEEKLERKRLLREYRRERRVERKANAEAFKEAAKLQNRIRSNPNNTAKLHL